MAYKRQIDRLPIIPADAVVHNVTCHYCIVGCGYKAYTWPVNRQSRWCTWPRQSSTGGGCRVDGARGVKGSEVVGGRHSIADCLALALLPVADWRGRERSLELARRAAGTLQRHTLP